MQIDGSPEPLKPTANDLLPGMAASDDPTSDLRRPVLLFDDSCAVCSRWVRFIVTRERAPHMVFAPVLSESGRSLLDAHGLDVNEVDSVVLVEDGRALTKSAAVLAAARHLRAPWSWLRLGIIVPRILRDAIYDRITIRLRGRLRRPSPNPKLDAQLRGRLLR